MLHLPPELVLKILEFLPFSALSHLLSLNKSYYDFFTTYETTIFHNAAFSHGYIPSCDVSIDDALALYPERAMKGVGGWKDLCRVRLAISLSWSGLRPSRAHSYRATMCRSVHRIKVDESAGIIITTSQRGGIAVIDMDLDVPIWGLPEYYVRAYAHCEYSRGYLVFDRRNGQKEIWRLTSSMPTQSPSEESVIPSSRPDEIQLRMSRADWSIVFTPIPASDTLRNGRFEPWALLNMPEITRAFRLVGHTLLVAASERVYLWDVRTGSMVQTIEGIQTDIAGGGGGNISHRGPQGNERHVQIQVSNGPFQLGDIKYVELSERHVFICGSYAVRIFERSSGQCIMHLPAHQLQYGRWECKIKKGGGKKVEGSLLVRYPVQTRRVGDDEGTERVFDSFVAVHVSKCGSHMYLLLNSSRLLVMHDFERAARYEVTPFEITIDIQIGSPRGASIYLAVENGRVGVITQRGVFIVHVNSSADTRVPPDVAISRIATFDDGSRLEDISCLQMSDTGFYFTWNWQAVTSRHAGPEFFEETVEEEARYAPLPNDEGSIIMMDPMGELHGMTTVKSIFFNS